MPVSLRLRDALFYGREKIRKRIKLNKAIKENRSARRMVYNLYKNAALAGYGHEFLIDHRRRAPPLIKYDGLGDKSFGVSDCYWLDYDQSRKIRRSVELDSILAAEGSRVLIRDCPDHISFQKRILKIKIGCYTRHFDYEREIVESNKIIRENFFRCYMDAKDDDKIREFMGQNTGLSPPGRSITGVELDYDRTYLVGDWTEIDNILLTHQNRVLVAARRGLVSSMLEKIAIACEARGFVFGEENTQDKILLELDCEHPEIGELNEDMPF